ncbi:peptidyl-prolyl cis-trans isomerase [Bacillus sp. DTU_2020_1000418_1_SI_GHA_SEK_038]|uniref:peptidyl-prolyl cis-trans isomerase n=1 Tax=Bacillus sp. DTU_2020_1000418_1_SI_GHA_SEK_038 TaxID=3077585 RepID=UPI0028E4182E|nr:peptidyl-prolyl cis-trans isomerase [Bacillus sp. DTU_2020_1000418_1_SI_GHA_SEK_038]WNS77034.1 peptidyl-prolyl cis-trans isomerase [Bacillus sp. DTU_2020_1000418_1_SI_GHA_SEK_038]
MENIISLSGNVKYSITLDPGVWIFDDRRVDLLSFFDTDKEIHDALEEYTKSISKHWDREIMEGAIYPPTLKTEKKFEKEKVLNGTFGIPLKPFIQNAEPERDAATLIIVSEEEGEISMPLHEGMELVLGFSINGKPLKEDGPVYVYYGDGRNKDNPIKKVKALKIR